MSEFSIDVSPAFHEVYSHAAVGVMVVEGMVVERTSGSHPSPALEGARTQVETGLRQRFADKASLRAHPVLQAYKDYYKAFQKTYHVQSQLESVIFNGRSIPSAPAAVQAMFMAELDNMLLTAGHDLDKLEPPIHIGIGMHDQSYTLMNGSLQNIKTNDMCMADGQGIISSVIYGPDQRTRLSAQTNNAMFVVYAPEGIQAALVAKHFSDILGTIRLFSPMAGKRFLEIF